MDWIAHARANILAGNAPGTAAIEVGSGGKVPMSSLLIVSPIVKVPVEASPTTSPA